MTNWFAFGIYRSGTSFKKSRYQELLLNIWGLPISRPFKVARTCQECKKLCSNSMFLLIVSITFQNNLFLSKVHRAGRRRYTTKSYYFEYTQLKFWIE